MWTYASYILSKVCEADAVDCTAISFEKLATFIFENLYKQKKIIFYDGKNDLLEDLSYLRDLNILDFDDKEDISIWIFQGNPRRYDILNALSDNDIGNNIHWLVNRHRKRIKKGNLGLIWMSGDEAGIYALTRIESNPSLMKEYLAEKKYWLESSEKEEAMRVEMTILKRLINNPILKKTILKTTGLDNLSILRQFQGTNFPVRNSEWRIISQLL